MNRVRAAVLLVVTGVIVPACAMRPCEEGIFAPHETPPPEERLTERRTSEAPSDVEDRLRFPARAKAELDSQHDAILIELERQSETDYCAFYFDFADQPPVTQR